MSGVKLRLIVLETHRLGLLRDFYSALGVSFTEEKHGDLPLHLFPRGDKVTDLPRLPADAGPTPAPEGVAVMDLLRCWRGWGRPLSAGLVRRSGGEGRS